MILQEVKNLNLQKSKMSIEEIKKTRERRRAKYSFLQENKPIDE